MKSKPKNYFIHVGFVSILLSICMLLLPQLAGAVALDTGFGNLAPNFSIYAVASQSDGKLIVGGAFSQIAGQSKDKIARFNIDGTLDTTFSTPSINDTIYSIAVQSDDKIIIAGSFTSIGGTTRKYIARLNSNGTLDTSFNLNPDGYSIDKLLIDPNGKIIVIGDFTKIGIESRNNIARLNSDGTVDDGFVLDSSVVYTSIKHVQFQSDNKMIILGYNYPTNRAVLVRVHYDGTLDATFNFNTGFDINNIYGFGVLPDGKILVSVIYGTYPDTYAKIIRLNQNGSIDNGFVSIDAYGVKSFNLLPDGRVVVGGEFNGIGSQSFKCIARLSRDGTLDTTFNANIGDSSPTLDGVLVLPDGKIVIYGNFTAVAGQTRKYLAVL